MRYIRWNDETEKKHKHIIDDFYKEYRRPPNRKEFEGWGGDLDYIKCVHGFNDSGYNSFLKLIGYTPAPKSKTYEVRYIRNDKIYYIGTSKDISCKFDCTTRAIRQAVKNKSKFQCEFYIVVKPYKAKCRRKKKKRIHLKGD